MMDACLASRLMEQQIANDVTFMMLSVACWFLFLADVWTKALSLKRRPLSEGAIRFSRAVLCLDCALAFFNVLGGSEKSFISNLTARLVLLLVAGLMISIQVVIFAWPRLVVLSKKLKEVPQDQFDIFMSHSMVKYVVLVVPQLSITGSSNCV